MGERIDPSVPLEQQGYNFRFSLGIFVWNLKCSAHADYIGTLRFVHAQITKASEVFEVVYGTTHLFSSAQSG